MVAFLERLHLIFFFFCQSLPNEKMNDEKRERERSAHRNLINNWQEDRSWLPLPSATKRQPNNERGLDTKQLSRVLLTEKKERKLWKWQRTKRTGDRESAFTLVHRKVAGIFVIINCLASCAIATCTKYYNVHACAHCTRKVILHLRMHFYPIAPCVSTCTRHEDLSFRMNKERKKSWKIARRIYGQMGLPHKHTQQPNALVQCFISFRLRGQ